MEIAEGGYPWERLLDALFLGVPAYQGVEYGENVAAVFDHTVEDVAEFGVALGIAVPLQEHRRGHLNIAAELLWGMAAQEETVEKGRLALRKREVCGDFHGNDLCNRGHKEKCSLPKSASASSGTVVFVLRGG